MSEFRFSASVKLIFWLFLLSAGRTYSQTTLPTLPSTFKWQQINTPHFQIIFPSGFETQGQRMANTMEHLYKPDAK